MLLRSLTIAISSCVIIALSCNSGVPAKKTDNQDPCIREICFVRKSDSTRICMFHISCIRKDGWDTLPEVRFWRRVVSLNSDSSLANVSETRTWLRAYSKKHIDSLEAIGQLELLRKKLADEFGLPPETRIRFTSGKRSFYNFNGVSDKMARAIHLFDSLGVDPFYAQSVLLIESPGSNKQKSVAGAYGHFQLMPFVAKQYGLRVDRYQDERENFDRSAYAAARLIREICVPYARKWCQTYGFAVDETALWFKLLALHCYNAGAGTVRSAMAVVPRSAQGNELIKTLWHTNAGYFQSEAQNYSQLALACYLEYEDATMVHKVESRQRYGKF